MDQRAGREDPIIEDQKLCEKMSKAVNPYGDGRAAERIANILLEKVYGFDNRS